MANSPSRCTPLPRTRCSSACSSIRRRPAPTDPGVHDAPAPGARQTRPYTAGMTLPRLSPPLFTALLPALLWSAAAAWAAPPARGNLGPVDGEVIVRFKPQAELLRKHALAARAAAPQVRDALAGRAAALGARLGRSLQAGAAVGDRTQVLRASGVSAAALAARLAADPDVEFAVPNGRVRRLVAPNDPLYPALAAGVRANGPDSGQWYLRAPTATVASGIDIETAWSRSTGSSNIVVAVIDTGVRPDHPDLSGRLVAGYDFVSNAEVANDGDGRDADAADPGDWVSAAEAGSGTFSGCSEEPSSWHGTSTASLVGASTNDGVGMAGTAPGVRVQPVRVLGKCFGTDSDIQAAMRWAAGISVAGVPDNPTPARVINLSLGGTGACSASYQAAVNEIVARGVVIVAAAGNTAGHPVGTPANCSGVIAVLALRHAGTKVGFSDLGPQITIAAPGGNCVNITAGSQCLYPILAATNTGTRAPVASGWTDSFDYSVGTSFASPLVAGTVGLMLSVQPGLSITETRMRLQGTARPFPTTGADNGTDPTPVTQCVAPASGVDQLQCYCSTRFCGAGMLDAGAAVRSIGRTLAWIDSQTASPAAGSAVTLSAASTLLGTGATISTYLWTVTDAGGIVSGFTSANNASTATLLPSAAGSFTVQLLVTDSLGATSTASTTVTVAAAPPVTTPPDSGGGGGGALSLPWLALLAAAVLALSRGRRRA